MNIAAISYKLIFISTLLLVSQLGTCQSNHNPEQQSGRINFHINETVTNKEEAYFQAITSLWIAYLESGQYVRTESDFWNYEGMNFPDYSYIQLLLEIRSILQRGENISCNIIGLIPVGNNNYLLKCMFTQQDSIAKESQLRYIVSIYAKRSNDKYEFINSTQYHKEVWDQETVGSVNYYIHPEHEFDELEANQMNEFNHMIADKFATEPIAFDYVVTNNTTQLNQLLGYDYNPYSYRPSQTGGLADNYNSIIYAGNNSSYYPHEVVHLYTNKLFAGQYHSWVDEGIATYFGGSSGYYLDWHLQKLKLFLAEHPNYELDDLSKLEKEIPNGEYTTDFRYAIGGLIIKKLYEQEGMEGLFDALRYGRTEASYFSLLEEKLQVSRADFGDYIRRELSHIAVKDDTEMNALKY